MAAQFADIAAAVRQNVRRHVFPDRERRILDLLNDLTFERGRAAVVIGELDDFVEALGIRRPHVSTALRELRKKRVVDIAEQGGWPLYRLLPDPTFWQTRAIVSRDSALLALRRIEAQNGPSQAELFPAGPSLADALNESSIEAERYRIGNAPVTGSVTDSVTGETSKTPEKGGRVTESVTGSAPLRVKSSEFSSLKALKLLNSEEGSPEGRRPAPGEADRLERCRELFGEPCMVNWGGWWRNRIRENPSKVDRVLSAVNVDIREGKKLKNPGGYARDLWKRFAD